LRDVSNLMAWATVGRWRGWQIDVRPSQIIGIFADIQRNPHQANACGH
jgi:hypothetical protein